jgi:hypothetical protein
MDRTGEAFALLVDENTHLREVIDALRAELAGANAMISAIERLVPDWKNYRDLAAAAQATIENLRAEIKVVVSTYSAELARERERREQLDTPPGGVMDAQERYETETGEKALYRMNSSDYHTLRYVRWLEAELAHLGGVLDEIHEGKEESEKVGGEG